VGEACRPAPRHDDGAVVRGVNCVERHQLSVAGPVAWRALERVARYGQRDGSYVVLATTNHSSSDSRASADQPGQQLRKRGRDIDAIAAHDSVLALDPRFGMALGNKGAALLYFAPFASNHGPTVTAEAAHALDDLCWCAEHGLFLHVSLGSVSEDHEELDPLFFRGGTVGLSDRELSRAHDLIDAFNL
jgi:hypothetical protein